MYYLSSWMPPNSSGVARSGLHKTKVTTMTTKSKMRATVLFGMLAIVMSFGIQTAVGSLRQMLTVMTASPRAMTTPCSGRALAAAADNNPSTGSSYRVEGCEVAISLMNFKFPGSTQHDDTILGGTQHNTWTFNDTDSFWHYGHMIDATVNYSTNTITMIASKEWDELSGVDATDGFHFLAHYRYAADEISKDITSRSEGSNAITDPEGNVPYVFIDILQGSLDVSQTSEPVNKGDLNSDGYITPADATIALCLAATGAHDDAADVSGDSVVTSLDALMILKAAAGG